MRTPIAMTVFCAMVSGALGCAHELEQPQIPVEGVQARAVQTASITLSAGDYEINSADGLWRIDADGYVTLDVPGLPALPVRWLLVLRRRLPLLVVAARAPLLRQLLRAMPPEGAPQEIAQCRLQWTPPACPTARPPRIVLPAGDGALPAAAQLHLSLFQLAGLGLCSVVGLRGLEMPLSSLASFLLRVVVPTGSSCAASMIGNVETGQ